MATISIKPSNNLWEELKKAPTDFISNICELIDNSLAAITVGECNVSIEVSGNWTDGGSKSLNKDSVAKIIITDDSSGIPLEDLGKALSPGAMARKHKNSLNEHGMGFKLAILGIGTKAIKDENDQTRAIGGFNLITKAADSKVAHIVNTMSYSDNIETEEIIDNKELLKIFPKGCGTKIIITNLDKIFTTRQQYTNTLVGRLGQRYQNILVGENDKKLNLTLNLTDKKGNTIKNSDGQDMLFQIQPVKAEWRESQPAKVKNLPIGKGGTHQKWSAEVKFGYNPIDGEVNGYNDPVRKEILKSSHPYHNKSKKIDIFRNDILICQKPLEWLLEVKDSSADRYFRNEYPRIQIKLYDGFSSTFTKNDIEITDHLNQLKEDLVQLLRAENYIEDKYTPKESNEEYVSNKLETILKKFDPNLVREFSVCGLRADYKLIRNGVEEIWELKPNKADGQDIAQLFSYLYLSGIRNGVIFAEELTDAAKNVIKKINDEGKYALSFEPRSDYHI